MQINVLEAKNRLSSLIVAAERDEEVIIARNGVPVAKIIKYTPPKVSPPGAWKGQIAYVSDWNAAEINSEIEQLFAGMDNASAT
jgi:prevent-host-death family protein